MSMTDKLINADILYNLVLQATDSKEQASEVMTNWVASRQSANKDPYATINLESVGLVSMFSEMMPNNSPIELTE